MTAWSHSAAPSLHELQEVPVLVGVGVGLGGEAGVRDVQGDLGMHLPLALVAGIAPGALGRLNLKSVRRLTRAQAVQTAFFSEERSSDRQGFKPFNCTVTEALVLQTTFQGLRAQIGGFTSA